MAVTPDPPEPGVAAPLDAPRLAAGLRRAGVPWSDVTVVDTTGSTNSDLVAAAESGRTREGSVIAAGEQTAGRGRLGRSWVSEAGTTLSFSVALAPPLSRAGFLPALTGLAVARTLADLGAEPAPQLKWPNDVMIGGRKAAGILAEAGRGCVVVGCGINVSMGEKDLPVPEATSLALAGVRIDRTELLIALLTELHGAYSRWKDAGFSAEGSGLLADYRRYCSTLNREIRVLLPDGGTLSGTAVDVDPVGRLVVAGPGGQTVLTAGDVIHVRD